MDFKISMKIVQKDKVIREIKVTNNQRKKLDYLHYLRYPSFYSE